MAQTPDSIAGWGYSSASTRLVISCTVAGASITCTRSPDRNVIVAGLKMAHAAP